MRIMNQHPQIADLLPHFPTSWAQTPRKKFKPCRDFDIALRISHLKPFLKDPAQEPLKPTPVCKKSQSVTGPSLHAKANVDVLGFLINQHVNEPRTQQIETIPKLGIVVLPSNTTS